MARLECWLWFLATLEAIHSRLQQLIAVMPACAGMTLCRFSQQALSL